MLLCQQDRVWPWTFESQDLCTLFAHITTFLSANKKSFVAPEGMTESLRLECFSLEGLHSFALLIIVCLQHWSSVVSTAQKVTTDCSIYYYSDSSEEETSIM